MRILLCLLSLAALGRADERDPEVRFLEAWFSMSEAGKAAAAEETFRELYEAPGTPRETKARCLLALAECARIAGDPRKERTLLEQVVEKYEGTDAAGRALHRLGPGDWIDTIRLVPAGWYLDLDDGTVSETQRPFRGKEAEMRDGAFLVEAALDGEMATKAAPVSAKPWHRVVTSDGRTSWVQILGATGEERRGRSTAVRLVTRLWGMGEILPAPRDPFCVGTGEGIEIHFEGSRLFARYRIERSAGEGEPAVFLATESPLLDKTADRGVRYLYRIAGETEDGNVGLAATLEGTRKSKGVVSGVAELDRGERKSFDFLLGKVVADGDVTLTGTYGGRSAASFVDALKTDILALAPGPDAPRSPWDDETQGTFQIPPGSAFLVRLRGGGVARCRLELPSADGPGDPEAILHYDACGDGAFLPMPVRLEAKRDGQGAAVAVGVEPPYRVEEVEVTDLVTGNPLAPIRVKDGIARDPSAREGEVREYRAVGVDRHGRMSAATAVTFAAFPDGPRAGEFAFHHGQGHSLETGRIVEPDQADVIFSACAGGIRSITLAAPGGIVSLERALPRDLDPGTAQPIFDLVLRADPQIELGRQAMSNGTPAADVFLMRTRHGGWAKLAILHRESAGDWQEQVATIRYVFNGKEPVFGQGDGETIEGVTFGNLQPLRARAQILESWRQGWQEIVQDPVLRLGLDPEPKEEGAMPDAAATQEVLWSRLKHRDYEKATFSFVFGIRDDPDLARARNDWCLQYGNGGDMFDVRMVTDDRSTITDLGAVDWKGLARRRRIAERGAERVRARFGHLYLVHTLDDDENFFSLFRVAAIRPGDQAAIEWISFRGETWARSPGLALDGATGKALQALVAALPTLPEKRWEGRERARATHLRLEQPELRVGVVNADLGEFLRDLGEVTGVQLVLEAKPGPVTVFGARLTPEGILDAICDQTGLRWQVREDGSASLGEE